MFSILPDDDRQPGIHGARRHPRGHSDPVPRGDGGEGGDDDDGGARPGDAEACVQVYGSVGLYSLRLV